MKANDKIIRREVFNLLLDFGYIEPIEVEASLIKKDYVMDKGQVATFMYNLAIRGELDYWKSGLNKSYRLTNEDCLGMDKLLNTLLN